ncbi:MAG: glutamate-1-semialdehyde 2,1-aminomutase [Candidatus Eremiobacteraeota bacterium]|nr:glutamate-1-semialdehyde 2,1-aminomutase [Candidatus Eremiobacteraeota bacterium]
MSQKRSTALFETAQRLFPGGVNSPVRAFKGVGGTPRFLVRGEGSRVYDADGREYIDYVCSWGPLILGHAHPQVESAIERAAAAGTSFGAPNPAEIELAELIVAAMPSIELLRFVSSGTEACMSALRLARAHTGRDMIVKFDGCYHGHADSLLVNAGSGSLTFGVPSSAGVPKAVAALTVVVPFNDAQALERAFKEHAEDIACVIIEPIAANMGLVLPERGFLQAVDEIAHRHRALLIFDEVITGFRVAHGGAQSLFGVRPDLTCLGKIIGAGLPVGAFGGRADIMRRLSPLGDVYQAGTLSGNPIAMAAGVAQLQALSKPGVYERLEASGAALEAGLRALIREHDASIAFSRVGSIFGLFFNQQAVRDLPSAKRSDTQAYASFFHSMLDHGVYLAPSAFEVGFLSLAHSRADIDDTTAAARAALNALPALSKRS